MRLLVVLAVCSLLNFGLLAQPETSPLQSQLDSLLQKYARDAGIIGATLSVVDLERQPLNSTFGHADLAAGKPVTPNTLFKIGSCTKTFTAIAILKLAEAGKIHLDKPVRSYLPELDFRKPASMPDFTVGDLLSHTSGLRDEVENGSFTWQKPDVCPIPDLRNDTLFIAPGHVWAYSNLGYGLLGCLIERVSGMSYGTYLKAHIFDPVGMNDTGLFSDMHQHERMSLGYMEDSTTYNEAFLRDEAAGDIVSTAADMNLFIEMLLRGGSINGQQILRPESYQSMLANRLANVALHTGEEFGYGLFIIEMDNVSADKIGKLYGHKGDTRMFHSIFFFAPELGVGLSVLTNSHDGDAITNRLTVRGLELYLKQVKGMDMSEKEASGFHPAALRYSPLTTAQLEGEYDLSVVGTLNVKRKSKRKMVWKANFDNPKLKLKEIEPGLFEAKVVLFKILPLKVKSMRIFFEEVAGDIYMKQISEGETASSYLAKKRNITYTGTAWQERSGDYEIINLQDGTAGMVPISMRVVNGLVYLNLKDNLGTVTQEVTFEPVSDGFAIHHASGRGAGNYLQVLENGNLYYSGFELRRRS